MTQISYDPAASYRRTPCCSPGWAKIMELDRLRLTRTFQKEAQDLTEMDTVSPAERSAMMAGIRGKDTAPELRVRRAAHALGYRFRLHRRDLPGSPDLVFPRLRKVILVHGCYWHRHPGCRFAYTPKSNESFWARKFAGNLERDQRQLEELLRLGWEPLVIWECTTYNQDDLKRQIASHLGSGTGK